jgi:hypothetical protein
MNYVQEIADRFVESCHTTAMLGPADFTLIAEWEKQGIPREVVLDAISHLHEPGVMSLVELRGGVRQYFVNWLQHQ